jgi:hypothetical protein
MDHEVIETPLAKRSCLYTAMVRRDSKPDNAATGRRAEAYAGFSVQKSGAELLTGTPAATYVNAISPSATT